MFYYFAKIGWLLAQPSSLILLLLVAGTVLLWSRYARAGRRLVAAAALLYAVIGLSPLGHAVLLPLEDRFPPADLANGPAPVGILLLGGAQDMSVSVARGRPALNEAGERFLEAAVLARRFPEAKILFSGGAGGILFEDEREARGAARIFSELGIARDRLLLEDQARNTYQNAVLMKAMAKPKPGERWLLVTTASHMPRAMGCFRQVGFAVEPWPVDYRTRGSADLASFFTRPSSGLRRFDLASRQWVGLLMYRLTGRTNALFPGP